VILTGAHSGFPVAFEGPTTVTYSPPALGPICQVWPGASWDSNAERVTPAGSGSQITVSPAAAAWASVVCIAARFHTAVAVAGETSRSTSAFTWSSTFHAIRSTNPSNVMGVPPTGRRMTRIRAPSSRDSRAVHAAADVGRTVRAVIRSCGFLYRRSSQFDASRISSRLLDWLERCIVRTPYACTEGRSTAVVMVPVDCWVMTTLFASRVGSKSNVTFSYGISPALVFSPKTTCGVLAA
jgi:hypothetical protein